MNDPRIYGTPEFALPGSPLAVPDAHVPYTPPVKVDAGAAVGTAGLPAAKAQAAAMDVLPATKTESAKAAWSQTLPMSFWEYATSPSVEPTEGYNKAAQMASLEITLNDNERAMLDRAESEDDFDYKLSRIEANRKASTQMGSHPFISLAVSMADPVQLGIDVGTGGLGLAARAMRVGKAGQRLAAGTSAVGLTYAAESVRQEVQPISDTEVVLTSLGNGAIAGMFYNPATKAVQKVDEDFPDVELGDAVRPRELAAPVPEAAAPAAVPDKPRVRYTPELPVQATPPLSAALPKELAGAKPRFGFGDKQFTVEFENDFDKAAYILAQKTPSKREADYLAWAMQASGKTEAEVRAHGATVRATIKEQGRTADAGALRIPDQLQLAEAKQPYGWNPDVELGAAVRPRELAAPVAPVAAAPAVPDKPRVRHTPELPVQATPPLSAALPKELAGAKPRFGFGDKQFTVEFENDFDKAAYILAQKTPSKREADYLAWAMQASGKTEAEVRAHGATVRATIKEQGRTADAGALRIPDQVQLAEEGRPFGWSPDVGVGPAHTFEAPDIKAPRNGLELATEMSNTFKGTEFEEVAEAILRAPELADIKVSTSDELFSLRPTARGFAATQGSKHGPLTSMFGEGPHKVIAVRAKGDADVALHELTHAVLQTRLAKPEFKHLADEMEALRHAVRRELVRNVKIPNGGSQFLHGQMESFGEFVAYSMSSPSFRKWAKAVRLTDEGVPAAKVKPMQVPDAPAKLTVWDKFMDVVSRVLGMGRPRLEKFLETTQNRVTAMKHNLKGSKYKALGKRLDEIARELTQGEAVATPLYKDGVTTVEFALSHTEKELRQKLIEDTAKTQNLRKVEWSLYGSVSKFSAEAKEWADTVLDDPLNMSGDSVVSQARAVRADLSRVQYEYEDLLLKAMAKRQGGLRNRIFRVGNATKVQAELEHAMKMELLARERTLRLGLKTKSNSTPEIKALADAHDKAYAAGLAEMKAGGVDGAEDILEQSGHFTRRWDSTSLQTVEQKLIDGGATVKEAHAQLAGMLAQGMRRANGWTDEVATDIAGAILDRTRRKGNFEDSAFRSHAGNEAAAELRDILTKSGLDGARLQRAMDVITGVVDEAGKVSILKRRIDIDMKAGIRLPDGSMFTVADLIDSNLTRQLEVYLDTVAGRVGLAKKGLGSVSAQGAARKKALASVQSIPEREKLAKLMDNTMDNIMGRPTGEDTNDFFRGLGAVNRMVALSGSGMWQATEFAPLMARYGGLKTINAMLKTLPQFRELYGAIRKDKGIATDLKNILAGNASQDTRLRPFIQRMEDNFEIAPGNVVQLALQQAQQLVPYANGQRFIQAWQARTSANLIVDTLQKAAKGDVRAMKVMEQYGLESGILQKVGEQIKAAGTDTSKWSDGVWRALRGPVTKAMDDAVLRARTGEIPAFAQFTAVGKFVFTFRNFVLAAHNKILLGTANRDGLAGLGKLMLMQLPLTYLATMANQTIAGKNKAGQSDEDYREGILKKAFSQVGSFGLFSEVFGVAMGTKQEFGAPGFIALDRAYRVASSISSNATADDPDWGKTAEAGWNALPILSITPVIKAIGTTFPKED